MIWLRAKGARAVLVVVLSGLSLVACGGPAANPSGTSTGASSSSTAPPNQSTSVAYDQQAALTMAIGPDPGHWNCDASGVDQADCLAVVDRIWPSVFHLGAGGAPQLDTTFVQSATQTSQSPQTVVYRINPRAVWSDGTAITYQDFVYNWQAQSGAANFSDVGGAPFTAADHQGYDDIASVTGATNNPDVVTVIFSHPFPDWEALFGAGDPIVPSQVARKVGYDAGFTDPVTDLVSAGPYSVQSYTPGTSVTLVRNPAYWGVAANLASVTFRFGTDPTQLPTAFKADEIGAAAVTATPGEPPPPDVLASLKNLSGVTVGVKASDTYEQLDFNQANPLLADPVLRHAIMLAVPRAAMLKRATGAADASIGLLDNRFFTPGSPGYKDDSGGAYDDVNLSLARQVLQKAGYTATAGSPVTKNGQPVTLRITAMSGDADFQAEEQLVVTALAHLGITVSEADTTDLPTTLAQGNFDLALDTATAGPFPSQSDAAYQTGGSVNVEKSGDPRVDALISQAESTFEPQRRQGLYDQIDSALWAADDNLPLFQLPSILASQSKYVNLGAVAGGEGPTFNLEQWGVQDTS